MEPETVGLFEGLTSTRSIRRYTDEDVPVDVIRDLLFAATRAPSGSNRQPTRYVVLRQGPVALEARRLLGDAARRAWSEKRQHEGYAAAPDHSPRARLATVMERYVEHLESVPVVVLVCLVGYRAPTPSEGASVYPACQNLLLAARALGYGGVMTGFHALVDTELRAVLSIPPQAFIAATITLGRPAGRHGPVRRRPLADVVFEDGWGASPPWAVDPPGTRFTSAGPAVPADEVRDR